MYLDDSKMKTSVRIFFTNFLRTPNPRKTFFAYDVKTITRFSSDNTSVASPNESLIAEDKLLQETVTTNRCNKRLLVDICDKKNIHLQNIIKHQEKGCVYQDTIGDDVGPVFVASPTYCAKVFREGKFNPILPELLLSQFNTGTLPK